jgi:predicted nucleic-acid-binding Zn-ribbon protein
MTADSVEYEKWYYVVDCARCGVPIQFKEALTPSDQPVIRLPAMRVRCPHCRNDHTYEPDLISGRQVSDRR